MEKNNKNLQKNEFNDQVEGRNAVLELLESGRDINKIYISEGERHGSINKIIAIAKERKIIINEIGKAKLNQMAQTENNQGVIAIVPPFDYCDIDDILEVAKEREEKPFILILDGIEDPHNLGAIMRTADATGIDGIIIPKNRSVSLNQTVAKVSTGAIEYVKVSQVTNLVQTIKKLKSEGFWVIGLDMKGSIDYRKQDYKGKIAVVIGSEGFGISRLVKENCDFFVNIPMIGHITSLNASVSASIIFYEILRNRFEN